MMRIMAFRICMLLLLITFILLPSIYGANQPADLCLDLTTAYDQNFKWYNTNGSLPAYHADHYLFTGSKFTNVYQDALSLKSIEAGKTFALSARVSVYIENLSASDRDEFAVFITDDTRVFTGDEFGFVVRQSSSTINGYIQSPRIPEFFKEFKLESIPVGSERTYTLKAVYAEIGDKGVIRFFINDISVFVHDFPKISGEKFYLVISSKKLSPTSIDTSRNYMKAYSACMINLPIQRADENPDASAHQQADPHMNLIITLLILNTAIASLLLALIGVMLRRIKSFSS